MRLLTARALEKTYPKASGPVHVLRGVDFELARGEAVAVMGPSGAGKSTLLNLLGGLDFPERGEIRLGDETLPNPPLLEPRTLREAVLRRLWPPRKLRIWLARWRAQRALIRWRRGVVGFVFQYHFLLPDFTALENLLVPVRLRGEPSADDRERARALLSAMGLTERADHRPGELSGGEQQRVAVARAFMNRPRVILADEPFGNLDPTKGTQLTELLFNLRRREDVSLVVVTHDRDLASRADRVLSLENGRLGPAAADSRGGDRRPW